MNHKITHRMITQATLVSNQVSCSCGWKAWAYKGTTPSELIANHELSLHGGNAAVRDHHDQ